MTKSLLYKYCIMWDVKVIQRFSHVIPDDVFLAHKSRVNYGGASPSNVSGSGTVQPAQAVARSSSFL